MSPLRVHLATVGIYSRAMTRVAKALSRFAPPSVDITTSQERADLCVLHVIGADAVPHCARLIEKGKSYAIIQYCFRCTALPDVAAWLKTWGNARLVWSYYDLEPETVKYKFSPTPRHYHAPLGVDSAFRHPTSEVTPEREKLVITTGYVSSPGSEPISEVYEAAKLAGYSHVHIGPRSIEGMKTPKDWVNFQGISDEALAELYRRASFVSALRHTEGFELPGVEGLCCGARPLVFDQPATSYWYGNSAVYIEESSGEELIRSLVDAMAPGPTVVHPIERERILSRFNWETIATGFWKRVLS